MLPLALLGCSRGVILQSVHILALHKGSVFGSSKVKRS